MTDLDFMARAIELARKGRYTTRPNPNVGCVIVKNNQIIGEGFHLKAGEPHAEIHALEQAGHQASGSTAYVTLEPCSHTNRTGPCADALIQAGISRVVCASLDPNPKVNGQGVEKLKAAGIDVEVGLLEQEAIQLNQGFFKAMSQGEPYVRLKIAASLDGKVALANGQSKWITGETSRLDVQKLRAQSAVIITGRGTFEADQPQMTVRQHEWAEPWPYEIPQPARVVCDRDGQLDQLNGFMAATAKQFDRNDYLPELLQWCVQQQYYDVMVEAGPTLSGAFLDQGLVDELYLYYAPTLLGPNARSLATIHDLVSLADKPAFQLAQVQQLDQDVRLIFQL